MDESVTNVVVAGLGGQGVLKTSDILAEAAFAAGLDVKKAEVHGMSQRGGSVRSDVRFGRRVLSPMVSAGEAQYLLVLSVDQVPVNQSALAEGGTLLAADLIDIDALANKRSLNVAMLGALSAHLDIEPRHWHAAIRSALPEKVYEANLAAFELGRRTQNG